MTRVQGSFPSSLLLDDVTDCYLYKEHPVELNQKIEHAIRCIKLGMTLEDSLFIAECTDDEMETLYDDEAFLRKVKLHQKLEEMDLLKQHNIAMEIATSRGNTKPIEWKLGIMNNKRWGSKLQVEGDFIPHNLNINLVGRSPQEKGPE